MKCIFCQIVEKKTEASILYEDELVMALLDIKPFNPGHALVIPKKHFENIFEIPEETIAHLYKIAKKVAIAVKKAVDAEGISIVQSNTVSQGFAHFHTHVVPRYFDDGMPIVWEGYSMVDGKELKPLAERIKRFI